MGGAKKRNLKQAEKQQQLQADKQQQQQKKTSKQTKAETSEKKGGLNIQEITEKDLNELAKIKALTPFAVATKYNLRLTVAKDVLETLEKKKTVQQVASGGGLKIYKFVGNA
ncbi:MAG: hypothetical protein V1850_04880 [Candidatus Bathyarchaeota archaeon]